MEAEPSSQAEKSGVGVIPECAVIKSESKAFTPHYLPEGRSAKALEWIGKRLRKLRGSKSPSQIAALAGITSTEIITRFEDGDFDLDLGKTREILRKGYGRPMNDILVEYYQAHAKEFDSNTRPFERENYYHFCLYENRGGPKTPMIIGGNPERFLWAIPLRHVIGQAIELDFLELAPAKSTQKNPRHGTIQKNAHSGSEIIYVIAGTVRLCIYLQQEEPVQKNLKKGDYISFVSSHPHYVENAHAGTHAFLLVTRIPESPVNKPPVAKSP